MKDIASIENRIKNIEYYTALSLLEVETTNMSLRDPQTNLERFKSGFFVDNFKSVTGGDVNNGSYKASVDAKEGRLRPQHYTTSIDLLLGSEAIVGAATSSNPTADYRFVEDLGDSNVKRIGDVVCLNYSDTVYLENNFATRIENVNPFAVVNWIGQVELNPGTDTWIETRRTAAPTILKVVSILQWESLVQIVTLVFHLLIGVHGKQLGQDQVHPQDLLSLVKLEPV